MADGLQGRVADAHGVEEAVVHGHEGLKAGELAGLVSSGGEAGEEGEHVVADRLHGREDVLHRGGVLEIESLAL